MIKMRLPGFGKIYRYFLFVIFRFIAKYPSQTNPAHFTNILITISSGSGLGNILLVFPTIKSLHDNFPHWKITLLCHENNIPEKLGVNKFVDSVLYLNKKYFVFSKIKLILDIRKTHFDLVINPEFYGTNNFIYSLIAFGNFSYRLGHVGDQVQTWAKRWSFLYNLKVDISLKSHETRFYQKILERLGINFIEDKYRPHITFCDEDALIGNGDYKKLADRPYICFAPGSNPNQAWKRWPYTKYAKLAKNIINKTVYEIVLLGTESDFDCAEKIVEMNNGRITNLCGKTNIAQVISLLMSAEVLVTNDSGLMHLANALDKTVIALYGPTDRMRTSPLGDNSIIVTNNLECSPCYNSHNRGRIGNQCKGRIDCLNSLHVNEVLASLCDKLNLSHDVF